jgi:hypothetical protein
MRNIMRIVPALFSLLIATPACADSYCDTLLGYTHDAPNNAIQTTTLEDRSGQQTVAQPSLPGARCLVAPYNPTGVKDHPVEQSVYCFINASDDTHLKAFDSINTRVATCLGQAALDDTFTQRLDYQTNYGTVRVSADEMTNDWAISISVMPTD